MMGLAVMRGFEIQDTASRIRSELSSWKPAEGASYEQANLALFRFLKKTMKGYPFEKEKASAGKRPGFVVGHEVRVEVVPALWARQDFDAVIAGLEEMKKWKGVILIVLTGKVKNSWRQKLDDYANRVNNDREFMSVKEVIVTRR